VLTIYKTGKCPGGYQQLWQKNLIKGFQKILPEILQRIAIEKSSVTADTQSCCKHLLKPAEAFAIGLFQQYTN
jgi:hypothetical protein